MLRKPLLALAFIALSYTSYAQLSKNWFNEDPSRERVAGVSSDRSYMELLKGKTSTTVIVAVIDGGTDVNHPDLKDNIWVNAGEIPDNGIDDDQNGYVDDVNGWNFIGGKTGDVGYDTFEATRVYNNYYPSFEGKRDSGLDAEQKAHYKEYQSAKSFLESELKVAKEELKAYARLKMQLENLKSAMNSDDFKAEDVANYKSADEEFNLLKAGIASAMQNGVPFDEIYKDMSEGYHHYNKMVNYHLNTGYDTRAIVGDNYADYSEKFYGNNNIAGPDANHGTHVAGIIGAVRDNDIGMNGVAANVKLMIVRVVPDGDERDKDVANGIRYAVDNGASIINMSFGKDYSPGKKYVDEAMAYAASKNVLMVHGAGNDASNIDKDTNFPNPIYSGTGERETAWIEVGALSASGNAAPFSNYSSKKVDVFAPGVSIYSTLPGNEYASQNGTSMASPVVAGIAALIRSYYPQLTASQVRQVILDSAIKIPSKTILPGSKKKKVKFTKLCISGGMVNAYTAIRKAETYPK